MNKLKSIFQNPQIRNSDYRPDVDGLRAIAVLSVIIYHINPALLSGGFAGVDVFFVISGYLITSHLLNEIVNKRTFSILKFYERRVRRIIPALVGVILFTLIFGYIYLTNFYFNNLGYESFSSLLSFSNIYFYLNTGYFDLDSSMRPLLHTWSLGVEEQFYLMWPILILIIYKFISRPAAILIGLILLIVISYQLNSYFVDDPNALFYLMPFRVFELAGGGVIAWLHNNKITIPLFENNNNIRNVFSLIGLMLLILPFIYLKHGMIFPYYNAIYTLIGCMILIYVSNTYISRLLSSKVIVYVGLLSYSLYLYHWPIIFYTKYLGHGLSETEFLLIALGLTLLLSFISYQIIERPFRYIKNKIVIKLLAVLFSAALAISFAISNGSIESLNSSKELIGKGDDRFYYINNKGCQITTADRSKDCNWSAENQLLFLGNSHNLDGYNIFSNLYFGNPNYNLIFGGNTNSLNCDYEFNKEKDIFISKGGKCNLGAERLNSKKFVNSIDVLVINYFKLRKWGGFHKKIITQLIKLNPNIKIIIMGGFIGLRPEQCKEIVNKTGNLDACKDDQYVTFWGADELEWIKTQTYYNLDDFLYIDRILLLCGPGRELRTCKIREGKNLFFYDGDHFSLTGSKYLAEKMLYHYKDELTKLGISK